MLLRGALDPVLDLAYFVGIVLGGIILVIDIAPCSPDMLGRVDRVLVVGWVGELNIAICMFALAGVDIVATIDMYAFLLFVARHHRDPFWFMLSQQPYEMIL